jgi:hypothetical protein
MATYRAVVTGRAGVNTANTVYFQLRSAATNRLRLREMIWTITTAPTTAPLMLVSRSTAVGTSSTTVAGVPNDPADAAATGTLDSAWSVAPTFNTGGPHLTALQLATTVGGVFYWASGDPTNDIIVPVSSGLSFAWSTASGATLGAHSLSLVWDE